jgi:hypothetical protein
MQLAATPAPQRSVEVAVQQCHVIVDKLVAGIMRCLSRLFTTMAQIHHENPEQTAMLLGQHASKLTT